MADPGTKSPRTPRKAAAGNAATGGADSACLAQKVRWARIFREWDKDQDGLISREELGVALRNSGFGLQKADLTRFLKERDSDGDNAINFEEFCEMALVMFQRQQKSEAKNRQNRIPQQYLEPESLQKYLELFKWAVGDDGVLDTDELLRLLEKMGIKMSKERVQGIMTEVDTDGSGHLNEAEFFTLLIRAGNLKKRKVGPGLCPVKQLFDEGCTARDLKRLGYDCESIVELGIDTAEIMLLFSPTEMRNACVPLKEILAGGWDCSGGREAGYNLEELVEAQCSIQAVRNSGFDDFVTAVNLRRLRISAKDMKQGGWPLSQLKLAGFSSTELRLAGYSAAALVAIQTAAVREHQMKAEAENQPGMIPRVNTLTMRNAHDSAWLELQDEEERLNPKLAGAAEG